MFLPTRTRRAGFTLVELMVSAAVCVVIMAVLSTVFQTGIDTMRDMRSVGSLQDQLRAATEMIRRDLQADHFVARDSRTSGHLISGARLSDQWLTDANWPTPVGGFFRIESTADPSNVASDSDSLAFNKRLSTSGALHFTSILPGNKPQNLYAVNVGSTVSSPAAEVCYFLDGSLPTNLRLIRRQRLVARTDSEIANFAGKDPAGEVIAGTGSTTVYTLANIAQHRMPRTLLGGARAGDDILLSNVLMFEVKANWDGSPAPRSFTTGTATDAPFDFLDGNGGSSTFDTGNGVNYSGTLPGMSNNAQRLRIKGLQIRIRIYDPQMQTTRQVTIVQDM